jgi:hypothetical protein
MEASLVSNEERGAQKMSTSDPMAAVRRYIDAFNPGDANMMAEIFSVPVSILDGMARPRNALRRCWKGRAESNSQTVPS